MSNRVVFFDMETGGLEPSHPTIQIAACAIDLSSGEEFAQFERKLRFDVADCSPRALELNSFDADVWDAEAVEPAAALDDFLAFLRDHADMQMMSKRNRPYTVARLGGHNIASFDIPRLLEWAGEAFVPACWWYPLDTLHLAIWHFASREPPANYRLTTLGEHLGLDVGDAHDALVDVRLSAAVARALVK